METPADPPDETGKSSCLLCGETFPREQMIPAGSHAVCQTCKPDYVQMMREGLEYRQVIVRRAGNLVVMGKRAQLPETCVKCGEPGNGRPIFIQVDDKSNFIHSRRITVSACLCNRHARRRRRVFWAAVLWIVFVCGMTFLLPREHALALALVMVSLLVFFPVAIVDVYFLRVLTPKKTDKNFIWLRGAGEEFLQSLTRWQDEK